MRSELQLLKLFERAGQYIIKNQMQMYMRSFQAHAS